MIKGQWRVFDWAVVFGFKNTNFYIALKWTKLVESATWGIFWSIMQVERAYSMLDAWGYYSCGFILNPGEMLASQSVKTLKLKWLQRQFFQNIKSGELLEGWKVLLTE